MFDKLPSLNRDYSGNPNSNALERNGSINHGSPLNPKQKHNMFVLGGYPCLLASRLDYT